MKALTFDQQLKLLSDAPAPVRAPGEALVSVKMAGICDTDLQLTRGYMNFAGTLGHEFVGEVLESDDPQWIGKRVVADINAGCGLCEECRLRDGHHCVNRTVLGILNRNGAFAEQLVIPERCLIALDSHIPDDQAVFAEPLAAALHVLDECAAHVKRAIVVGDGKLGLLIAMALRSANVEVLCVGHHQHKLLKLEETGCQTILESELESTPEITPAPLVVEATGTATGLARALSLTAPRGTLVLKTTVAEPLVADFTRVVVDEIRIVGSRCGSLQRAVDALSARVIDPTVLIDSRYALKDGVRAIAEASRRGVCKVLLEM
jgi:threonine dehydrogenase-like Zn-dependent dehydrogenase